MSKLYCNFEIFKIYDNNVIYMVMIYKIININLHFNTQTDCTSKKFKKLSSKRF